jgi:hypothetical protein
MQTETRMTIRGYLVGAIWMPNTECYKPLAYDLTREDARFTEPGTLRDHVLAATNDGDFQSCAIADGFLIVERVRHTSTGYVKRSRTFELSRFPSVSDCLRPDWDGPSDPESWDD